MSSFTVSPEVEGLGLKGAYLFMQGVSNKESDPRFEELFSAREKELASLLTPEAISSDSVLQGFRDLHAKVGVSNRKHVSSPENLLLSLLRTGRFPRINLLVDIYNYVSVGSHLALGAHDLRHVEGDISLRLTDGSERFQPLGSQGNRMRNESVQCVDGNQIMVQQSRFLFAPLGENGGILASKGAESWYFVGD